MPKILLFVTVFILTVNTVLFADDAAQKAATAKVKTASEAAWKKLNLKSTSFAETEHFLVYATLPESKLKPITELAEKSYDLAVKTLKVEKPNELFTGKLVVFLVGERRPFTNLVSSLSNRRPEQADTTEIKTRGDLPYVAVSVGVGGKESDIDWPSSAATLAAAAVLNKKLGTEPEVFDLPEWTQLGFGKIISLKAENNATKLANYRTKAKQIVAGKTRGAVKINDAWTGPKGKEYDIFTTSIVDFMLFGDSEKFNKFCMGFKKDEMNLMPNENSILNALEWKWEDLDLGWKQFVIKAK